MKHYRVSYILPTIGRPDFFKATLANVSTYISKDDELIVIDGSADDSTYKIVTNHRKLVTKYFKAENTTECYKMNVGILHSEGDIIKPISDDDYIYPRALKNAINILENDVKLDALQCGGEAYIHEKGTLRFLSYKKVPQNVFIGRNLESVIQYNSPHTGLIFKSRILPKIGLYDISFTASDIYIISMMIHAKVTLKYLDICTYRTIVYPHSTDVIHNKDNDKDRSRLRLRSYNLSGFFQSSISSNLSAVGLDQQRQNIGFFIAIRWCYNALSSRTGRFCLTLLSILYDRFRRSDKTETHTTIGSKKNVRWTKKYW